MEKRIKLVGLVLSCLTLFAACGEKEKEIPVYLFMGFLGSGKTTFAKDTLLKLLDTLLEG